VPVLTTSKSKLLLFLLLAVVLVELPIAGKYFAVANTLIHEVGHQVSSIVTFGKAHNIQLFANTEGVAYSSHRFWIGQFITSLAGYIFASFMACTFMVLTYKGKHNIISILLLIILGLSLIFWVRNLYGFFWITTFSIGFVWLLLKAKGPIKENVILFLVSIIFIESITSAFEIMYMSFQTPLNAGDAANLAEITYFIPTQFWGLLFFAQSLLFGWIAMKRFFPFLTFR